MAKKVQAHKKSNCGLQTIQNSVEFQVETSQPHCSKGELPYPYQVEDGCPKSSNYSNLASLKKLNNGGFHKQSSTRNNAPSLVARLMGIDTMPLDTKPVVVPSVERKIENMEMEFAKKGMKGRDFDSFYKDIDDDEWGQNFVKPKPREHPQEVELQKFKKEFEAYQAERSKECSMVQHIACSKTDGNTFPSRSKTLSIDFEESLIMKCRSRLNICASPTQIVILKPACDGIYNCNHEEKCINLSGTLQGRKSIEDFLEEVRERLKCELQGNTTKKGFVNRANGIETPNHEIPSESDPTNKAHILNLLRTESARSYKSETRFNGPSSPESFMMDTRKFLSERVRNDMKNVVHFDIPEVGCGNSKSYMLDYDRVRQMNCNDMMKRGILKEKFETPTGSYRHIPHDNLLDHRELSPRNLVRSLSAPASGASFEKLLLEDRHVLTGALIRRKLEAVEAVPVDAKKLKKDRFNIKEKILRLKYSLGLRGKLFGKRVQSIVESHSNENGPILRDIRSGPTVLMKYGERHENSTEVPPSPASMCSSAFEERWKQTEHSTPISTPDVSSLDDIVVPKAFRDISSGLNELRRQLSQLDSDGHEDLTIKQKLFESELIQLDDPAESYVRDLLVASGLYFGSWNKSLLRGDSFAKAIGNSVFEEVEESHKKMVKENERSIRDQNKNNKLEHKVLHDLLNEALSVVLRPPLTLSGFRRKPCNSSMQHHLPCGKELLKLVWDIVCVSLYPEPKTSPYSLDSLVAEHLGSVSWFGLINDEIDILESETAFLVTDDLVEELTRDIMLC
ncbi:hypothetical protein RJT34_30346 [Clitoria ternatea]|uniref:DUF4378 domain-containing protein n=1 Tax=Clitoria ternatea TaxID=43366 RepID=A0AAN9I797_CLITE